MADNVAITAGSGTTVSTEEVTTLNGGAVSAQHVQRVLPATRTADGTAIDEAAGAGAVSSSTKRVTLASDDPAVTALQIMDDWDESDRAKVNPIVGQAGVAAGTGASGATTQRVVAASDSPDVTALQIMDDWDNGASDGASVSGDVAHDAADAGEPVKIGFKAESSPKGVTLVSDGDRTDGYADIDGIQIVKLNTANGDLVSERVSNTDGASTAFSNFSAVASTRNYVTAIHVFRTDAGTTPIYVDFRDGTAGSILYSVVIPPSGGAILPATGVPYFRTSANTALAYDVSAATTTVYISVSGFQSKA